MEKIIGDIPDFIKYIAGLIITAIAGWFAHRATRKKTDTETDGIDIDNKAKIRKLREEEIKHLLDKIDTLEKELEECRLDKAVDQQLLRDKEKELADAKIELYECKRQLTKALILNSQLQLKQR